MKLHGQIKTLYEEHKKRIGSPKMKIELDKKSIRVGKNRIAKIMKENGYFAITHKQFHSGTTDSKHTLPVAENLLNRQFQVAKPDQVWVTDATYVKTQLGWAYLVVFIDLFSRMIVGWAISDKLDTDMFLSALHRAIQKRNPSAGLMVHSDRGCQYASERFREALRRHQFVQSMSRKGNCWDNAVAESFFRIYKTEMAYHETFLNKEDVLHKSFEYIECYYNRKRRHGTIGYMTPAEFEKLNQVV